MATYFFAPPLNKAPAILVDNRYDKSTVETTLTVHIDANGDGTGAARGFTHIFLKAKGTIPANYTVTPSGDTNISPFTEPFDADVTDLSDDTRSRTVKGFYNYFYHYNYVGGIATAQSLAFTFPGAGLDLVQLLILRSVVEVDDNGFSDIRWLQRLGGLEQRSARGSGSVAPPIAGNRDKYDLILTAHKNTADNISRALDAFFSEYPEFVFATEPDRYPEQVFRAKNRDQQVEYRYNSQYKGRGRRATFTISEL